jgi:predicted ATP-grasp superfamily ATP-dependent carboligase
LSIEIKYLQKDKKLDMRGGVIIDGFPSAGLINAIASECLIRSGGTELYAIIDSSDFPPLSIVNQYTPQFPILKWPFLYLNSVFIQPYKARSQKLF